MRPALPLLLAPLPAGAGANARARSEALRDVKAFLKTTLLP